MTKAQQGTIDKPAAEIVCAGRHQDSQTPAAQKTRADARRELGQRGEEAAATFLQGLGQRILARNWRCRFGEVDLITRDGETIAFCEVKTRKSVKAGQPSEAITVKKQQKYSKLAALWLGRYGEPDCAARFDAVSVLVTGEHSAQLTLIKGAFSLAEEF